VLHTPSKGSGQSIQATLHPENGVDDPMTCCAGGGKPTYIELVELQSQGRASPITSSLLHELDSVLSVTQHWLHRCTAAVARRSAQSLKACLDAMAASVQRAQEQMEAQLRKLQVSRQPAYLALLLGIAAVLQPLHILHCCWWLLSCSRRIHSCSTVDDLQQLTVG